MYKGKRDPEILVLIPPESCGKFIDKRNKQWIEVAIPPEDPSEYTDQWGTIMVDPGQVNYIKSINKNIIGLNDGATILVSIKDPQHVPLSSEYLTPIGIIARWLKYYRYTLYQNMQNDPYVNIDIPSEDIYKDYFYSGLRMEIYLNKLPIHIDTNMVFETQKNPYANLTGASPIAKNDATETTAF